LVFEWAKRGLKVIAKRKGGVLIIYFLYCNCCNHNYRYIL